MAMIVCDNNIVILSLITTQYMMISIILFLIFVCSNFVCAPLCENEFDCFRDPVPTPRFDPGIRFGSAAPSLTCG